MFDIDTRQTRWLHNPHSTREPVARLRFTWPHFTGGYGCSLPGNMASEYVPLHALRGTDDADR